MRMPLSHSLPAYVDNFSFYVFANSRGENDIKIVFVCFFTIFTKNLCTSQKCTAQWIFAIIQVIYRTCAASQNAPFVPPAHQKKKITTILTSLTTDCLPDFWTSCKGSLVEFTFCVSGFFCIICEIQWCCCVCL